MSLKTFEYRLPEFITPEGYDSNSFIKDSVEIGNFDKRSPEKWEELRSRQPWLDQLLPPAATRMIYGVSTETAAVDEVFRGNSEEWHIDPSRDGGEKVALLRTSTPTEFASCLVHVDTEAREAYEGGIRNPASDLRVNCFINWLELAASDECNPRLRSMIRKVEGLTIVQAMPGVIAVGKTVETLHRAAKRHPDQPELSVIARAIYS